MRAGIAVCAEVFQLPMRAGVALRAAAFHPPMRAAAALCAVDFQLAMRAAAAVRAVVFHLPMRAGVAVRTAEFHSAVRAPFIPHTAPPSLSSSENSLKTASAAPSRHCRMREQICRATRNRLTEASMFVAGNANTFTETESATPRLPDPMTAREGRSRGLARKRTVRPGVREDSEKRCDVSRSLSDAPR